MSATLPAAFPWLTTLGVVPLVGAFAVLALRRTSAVRGVALGFSLLTLVVSLVAATRFDASSSAQFQLAEVHAWMPQFGVSYAVGVDGTALLMILMTTILVPVSLLAAWHDVADDDPRTGAYFAWMLVLEALTVGVFSAIDVMMFYVLFEAVLIPVYFLIGGFGGAGRHAAATKFILFGLTGGFIMLAAVLGLFFQGPGGGFGFLVTNLTGLGIDPVLQRLLFVGFFIAFAIKAPMWPVHTWLPDAAQQARPATSVLLVGVLDKIGTFGMIRFCLQLFPEASRWAAPVVIVLALVSIVYGALVAIGQQDMMRLIAYTSVSHFGFIVLGIFAFTRVSASGSVLYMLNHGFSTAALFLVAGMLVRRRGSALVGDYGGWQRVTPVLAGCFLVAGLSALALPGLSSFVSEFLVMMGTYQRHPWAAAVASVGIVLAALYVLLMYQRVMTGAKPADADDVPDLTGREKWVVAPLVVALVVLGFFPKPALDVVTPAVATTLQHVGVTDPAPISGAINGRAK